MTNVFPRVHGVISQNVVNLPLNLRHLYLFSNGGNLGEDSIEDLDLTNNNGVTQVAGEVFANASNAIAASNQYFEVALPSSELDLNGDWTISVWAKITNADDSGGQSVFAIYTGGDSEATIYDVFGGWGALIGTNGFEGPVRVTPGKDANMHHHVVIKQGTTGYYYYDGVLQPYYTGRDEPIVLPIPQDGTTVFRLFRGNTVYSDGTREQVGLWDRALNVTEVRALYNSGSGTALP